MGARGPAPKRSDQRRRANTPAAGAPEQVSDSFEVVKPDPAAGWHEAARLVWDSLRESGQSVFYTSTDWASAYLLCESISRELSPQPLVVGSGKDATVEMVSLPPKGASQTAWRATMAALLMTEGDRRRAAIELTKPKPAGAAEEAENVSSLDAWRTRTDGTG